MVEGVDLERLYGSNIIEGSNPSLSDYFFLLTKLFSERVLVSKDFRLKSRTGFAKGQIKALIFIFVYNINNKPLW